MTALNRPVTRNTGMVWRRREIVIELHPGAAVLRLKGARRDRFAVTYTDLIETLAWREARRAAAEKRAKKRGSK